MATSIAAGIDATSLCETWAVLLWVTSPASGGFAYTRLKCLLGAQASQFWFRWAAIAVFHRICFAL